MEEKYCQSCGMPMGETDELYGTEKNGGKSKDYCQYCYENGQFTADVSMQEMIDMCAPHMEANAGMSEEDARKMMQQFFPMLKRWQ
ncbi:hypothetical protein MsAg5_08040 [Methanosarcinaceae archaeon Ag5]|uniref:Putative zinc ribbon domain-containing protein n=1 Tax=Methanolapillus africanus TaxID=3028297 RepID=A0AAE4SCX7_9EURY|nr:hypothetical protein [Methanosarcinaceae archaeon Ag5]